MPANTGSCAVTIKAELLEMPETNLVGIAGKIGKVGKSVVTLLRILRGMGSQNIKDLR
jgi:hypothetical protein